MVFIQTCVLRRVSKMSVPSEIFFSNGINRLSQRIGSGGSAGNREAK